MSMLKLLRILPFLACAALADPAFASPILGLELQETGFADFIAGPTSTNPLVVNQAYGTFTTNVEVTTAADNPASLSLNSTNFTTNSAGTLVITASATDILAPNGGVSFLSQLTGQNFLIPGSNASLDLKTYVDNSNTLFGKGTLLADEMISALTGLPQTATDFPGGPPTLALAPFALTEVLTITTTGPANVLTTASVTGNCIPGVVTCSTNPPLDVPEPGSLIMLGSALVGLGGVGWYRRRQRELPAAV